MAELRRNPLTDEVVCFSEKRASRPMNFSLNSHSCESPEIACPFCKENSNLLAEVLETSESGNAKSVTNLYPAITTSDIFPGMHEVVIDTLDHEKRLSDFKPEELFDALILIKRRYAVLSQNHDIKSIQIFRNQGVNAGASLKHSHWQIIALPEIPARLMRTSENIEKLKNCPVCEEAAKKELLVNKNELFVSLAPFASRFCYEISVRPIKCMKGIQNLNDEYMLAFSDLLIDSAKRIESILPKADINVLINNPPVNTGLKEQHLSVDIFPRLGRVAGFELLSSGFINHVLPENAAETLRNVNI